jgi:hypothetical protein
VVEGALPARGPNAPSVSFADTSPEAPASGEERDHARLFSVIAEPSAGLAVRWPFDP